MARFLRFLAWTAGTLVVLAAVAIGVVYFYVTSDDFRGRIESQASTLAGRKTTIADISIDWGLTSHVHMSGVSFANAEWAKEPHMLKAEQVDFEIRLWPLLKGDLVLPSLVLVYMGAESVISKYEPPGASKIKDGKSIGYDVNAATNGVWLPSPYALSNSNKWPSQDGLKVVLQRLGQVVVDETESFKSAYVAASIEASGHRQFHMRHEDYSYKVQEILDAMGNKIKLMSSKCPVADDGKDDGKFDPPVGLKTKLDGLSARMKSLLIGAVWRPPFFTDDLSEEYSKTLQKVRRSVRKLKVM